MGFVTIRTFDLARKQVGIESRYLRSEQTNRYTSPHERGNRVWDAEITFVALSNIVQVIDDKCQQEPRPEPGDGMASRSAEATQNVNGS
jgi:hypothetical protein